jgi:hypothetical protein
VSAPRIDTSHIKSPRDPMTPEEREAVRAELRDELAELERYFAEHGGPWDDFRADLAAEDDHAA